MMCNAMWFSINKRFEIELQYRRVLAVSQQRATCLQLPIIISISRGFKNIRLKENKVTCN